MHITRSFLVNALNDSFCVLTRDEQRLNSTMGSPHSKVMKEIPKATNRDFQSRRAMAIIRSNPEDVLNGIPFYDELRCQGRTTLFKQKVMSVDKSTLSSISEMIKHWNIQDLSTSILHRILTTDNWVFESNEVEEINISRDGTTFLYYVIQYNYWTGKYNMVVCHLKTDVRLNSETMIAGLISEGILGKDDEDKMYLQI